MANGQLFEPLDVTKVSPFIVENHKLGNFILIPLLLSDSVRSDGFEHKISTPVGVNPSGETVWKFDVGDKAYRPKCDRIGSPNPRWLISSHE